MPSTSQTAPAILVVGVTGMMGQKIANSLLDREATLRAIIRPSGYQDARARLIEQLRQRGVDMVEADLHDPATLPPSVKGIEVIVSAVQGSREVIVEGQNHLLDVATQAGVKRFIPSDFSVDLFKLPDGSNRNLDLRRAFDRCWIIRQ